VVASGLNGAIECVGGTIDNERQRTMVDTECCICRDKGVRNNNARNEGANMFGGGGVVESGYNLEQ